MRAATVVQVLQDLFYVMFYCMFYFTCDRSFKPNTHRRRDSTRQLRRVGVGVVYMNSQLAHDDCRRIQSTICKLIVDTP